MDSVLYLDKLYLSFENVKMSVNQDESIDAELEDVHICITEDLTEKFKNSCIENLKGKIYELEKKLSLRDKQVIDLGYELRTHQTRNGILTKTIRMLGYDKP